MDCFAQPLVNGQSASGGGSAPAGPELASVWEADLADQGSVAFADGAQNITGIDSTVLGWTVARTVGAASGTAANWGFNANGLNWLASTTSGTWVAGTQTASNISIPTDTLLTTFNLDFTARLIVELFFTLSTWSAGTPDIGIGFAGLATVPNNSSQRMWVTKRGFRAATDVSLAEAFQSTTLNYTTAPGPTADVLAVDIDGGNFRSMIGNAVVGPPFVWPQYRTLVTAGANTLGATVSTLTGTVLAINFSSNSVAGTTRIRANRIRIRSAE